MESLITIPYSSWVIFQTHSAAQEKAQLLPGSAGKCCVYCYMPFVAAFGDGIAAQS